MLTIIGDTVADDLIDVGSPILLREISHRNDVLDPREQFPAEAEPFERQGIDIVSGRSDAAIVERSGQDEQDALSGERDGVVRLPFPSATPDLDLTGAPAQGAQQRVLDRPAADIVLVRNVPDLVEFIDQHDAPFGGGNVTTRSLIEFEKDVIFLDRS